MKVRKITLELGEKEFAVKEAGWRKAASWRQGLLNSIKPLFENVAGMSDVTFDTPEDLLQLWPMLELIIADGIDVLLDHLLTYSDDLADNREYIEENATVAQVSAAFVEVAKLSIPFEAMQQLTQIAGSPPKRQSTKLPVRNGA